MINNDAYKRLNTGFKIFFLSCALLLVAIPILKSANLDRFDSLELSEESNEEGLEDISFSDFIGVETNRYFNTNAQFLEQERDRSVFKKMNETTVCVSLEIIPPPPKVVC